MSLKGTFKYNTDASSKDNPGPSSIAFCIRDWSGDLNYARITRISNTTSLQAEAMAILDAIEYYVTHHMMPLIIETDSLIMKKVIEGE